jgi:hypothetical protein
VTGSQVFAAIRVERRCQWRFLFVDPEPSSRRCMSASSASISQSRLYDAASRCRASSASSSSRSSSAARASSDCGEEGLSLGVIDTSLPANALDAILLFECVTARHSRFNALMRLRSSSISASSSSRCVLGGSSRAAASSATSRSRSVANRSTAECSTIANPPPGVQS